MTPALDKVRHLALYAAFHRSIANRVLHALSIPVIFCSAYVLLSMLPCPLGPSWAHLGVALIVFGLPVLGRIDPVGALCIGAWVVPSCLLAVEVAERASAWFVVPAAVAAHLLGWYATVEIGHRKFEPWVQLGARREDSNVYFRRSYFVARDFGCRVTWMDRLIQFLIAPLSSTQDVLGWVGVRRSLDRAVADERDRILARLGRGAPPFGS